MAYFAPEPPTHKPYVRWYGPCQRCRERADRAFIPGTAWLVCLNCYVAWSVLPEDHPAKTGATT